MLLDDNWRQPIPRPMIEFVCPYCRTIIDTVVMDEDTIENMVFEPGYPGLLFKIEVVFDKAGRQMCTNDVYVDDLEFIIADLLRVELQ